MAATTSHRAWEIGRRPSGSNITPRTGKLPSITALTNALPGAPGAPSSGLPSPASTRERDSGAWSSQPQSTRSSAYSSSINSYPTSNTNSYYMSPSRMSNSSQMGGATSHPADYNHAPTSAGPIGSPGFPAPPSLLPSINQVHEPSQRQSQEFPPPESRRSSLGSQVNQGLNSLHINGNGSPYTGSVNHSQTSLAQNLSRERGITHHSNGTRPSRSSGQQLPMSPLSPHAAAETRIAFTPRIAPPIGRNPRSDIYNADDPIPGQAYAFPDPPDVQPGDLPPMPGQRAHSNTDDGRPGMFSRRDSGHTSITSSIVTSDSRLPAGQRRLDENGMPGTHHHTLQQSQLSGLDGESPMADEGATPYSRTPALRVSHKMAERKRRSEMKDLFENLRSQIPSNQGSKSSKWEILTKASEYIKVLETSTQNGQHADKQLRLACHDLDSSRRENDSLRNENQRLMQEVQLIRQQQQQQQQQPPPPVPHSQPTPIYAAHHQYGPPPSQSIHDPSRSLPPLTNGVTAPSSMQGVQYSHDHR